MESLLEFLKTDNFILVFNIISFILLIGLIVYVYYLNKNYIKFMNKLGNGNNLDDTLFKKFVLYLEKK